MDDEAAILARAVATAATAWFDAPRNVDAYRRLADAVDAWKAYTEPTLEPGAELLDELSDASPPVPLGVEIHDLGERLREAARRAL